MVFFSMREKNDSEEAGHALHLLCKYLMSDDIMGRMGYLNSDFQQMDMKKYSLSA